MTKYMQIEWKKMDEKKRQNSSILLDKIEVKKKQTNMLNLLLEDLLCSLCCFYSVPQLSLI